MQPAAHYNRVAPGGWEPGRHYTIVLLESWDYKATVYSFVCALGIQTQVLTFEQQMIFPLSYL